MAIDDDGDIVRGLGYVTLYAAYMEEAVDACRQIVMSADPASPKGIERSPISDRVRYVRRRLGEAGTLPEELAELPEVLDFVLQCLEARNEVVHGRIYGGLQGEADTLRPGRPTGTARPIESAELYALANDMFGTLRPLIHASTFALPRMLNGRSP